MTMTDTPPKTETIEQRRERAHRLYLDYYAQGEQLTGSQLGNLCDRSERWGQERIREVIESGALEPAAADEPDEEPAAVVHVGETSEALAAAADDSIAAAADEAAVLTGTADSSVPVPAEPIEEPAAVDEPAAAAVVESAEEPAAAIEAPAEPAAPVGETSKAAATKRAKVWPVWVLMAPAAVAIWGGWVGLGEMAGFGKVNLLPGIANVEINTAITLPIGMEVYAAYALYVWLSGHAVGKALKFARTSAIVSLIIGAAGQMAYHVMEAAHMGTAPWPVTAVVAVLPVAVLGMGAALAHLVKAEQEK